MFFTFFESRETPEARICEPAVCFFNYNLKDTLSMKKRSIDIIILSVVQGYGIKPRSCNPDVNVPIARV